MNTILRKSRAGLRRYAEAFSRPARRIWPRSSDALLGILAILIIGLVALTYSPTMSRMASLWLGGNKYIALLDGLANPFRNRSLLLQSGLPIYDLKIKAGPFAELEAAAAEARKRGYMTEEDRVEVKAKFFHDNKSYDASVRIRGDLQLHWEGPKKSWRIQFRKEEIPDGDRILKEPIYFQGRRQINLVIPRDRDYVVAPLMNELLREAGLTVPRDQFVVLRINGRLQGLYYEVEHFDKTLFAEQQRPEATVFGQNSRAMHFEQYSKDGTPITADAKYDAGTLRLQVEEVDGLGRQAMDVLLEHSRNPTPESFRRARAVLDWEKYLQFRAVTTLLCTNHVRFGSDNLKLYYDPTRGLLEPIPWDMHLVRMPNEPGTIDFWNSHGPDELQRSTLLDPQLRLQRNQVLWKMVADGGEGLIKRYQEWHDRIRPLAWGDVLSTPIQGEKMDILQRDFNHNVRRVHKVLNHSAANLVLKLESDNQASIDIAALNFCGIHLSQLQIALPGAISGQYRLIEDANNNGQLDPSDPQVAEATAASSAVSFPLDKFILPRVKYRGENLEGVYWEFFDTLSGRARYFVVGQLASPNRGSSGWKAPMVTATAKNAVTGAAMASGMISSETTLPANSVGVVAYDASHFFDIESPNRTRDEFLTRYPQFRASDDDTTTVELAGKVELSETVIVPKHVTLRVLPGSDLTLKSKVSVVCYGACIIAGTPDQPIRIQKSDGDRPWGVWAVVRPEKKVVVSHAIISGGSEAQVNGIQFTGGLAVHEGKLELRTCQIRDMHGEDGVSVHRGNVVIQSCLFANNASDSCDLNFATGEVTGSRFINSRQDGLELSGSVFSISSCRFEHNGGNGCNVAKKSDATVVNCLYLGNQTAALCKESSHGRFGYCTFVSNQLSVEALRSDPIYNRSGGELFQCVFADNDQVVVEDYFSRNQVQVAHCWSDVPTTFPSCLAKSLEFPAKADGDYRVQTGLDGGATNSAIATPEWLQSLSIPTDLTAPGVYSELELIDSNLPPRPALAEKTQ